MNISQTFPLVSVAFSKGIGFHSDLNMVQLGIPLVRESLSNLCLQIFQNYAEEKKM